MVDSSHVVQGWMIRIEIGYIVTHSGLRPVSRREVKRFVESYHIRPDSSVIKVIQNALTSIGDNIDIRRIIYDVYKANVPLRTFCLTNLYELFAFNGDQCSTTPTSMPRSTTL
jgi:hypothetical protein